MTIFFFNITSHACSGLALSELPTEVNLNSNISPRIDFKVVRSTLNSSCTFRLGIDKGNTVDYNQRKLFNQTDNSKTLEFFLSKRNDMSAILKDPLDTNNKREYIQGKFKVANNPKKLFSNKKFFAEVILDPNSQSGIYQDTYYIKLYLVSGSQLIEIESRPIIFTYEVPTNVSLSLVNTNAPYDETDTTQNVDFGTLTEGEVQSFDVVIEATSGYTLSISSDNSGKLKHTTSPHANSTIDYIFRANGQPFTLTTNPVVISNGTGASPTGGFRIPLSFTIGNVNNKLSGTYEDRLTIKVTSSL